MGLATVLSRAQNGLDARLVSVEVHLAGGMPKFSMVGLPETAVKESKDRVRSAIQNSGFSFPQSRITVNLAPADLPKEGGRFDLPIALGILAADGAFRPDALTGCEFLGELSLGGTLRGIRGTLPAAVKSRAAGHDLVIPESNAAEAALVSGLRLLGAPTLLSVCAHLRGLDPLPLFQSNGSRTGYVAYPDLADVRGQHHARRALEIAAAGGHSLLLMGPPGTGKSMLAQRLPGLLPIMSDEESLQTAALASLSGSGFDPAHWRRRPFRAPHHTASPAALVGGGSYPRPGEISLAHNGVLFLDELGEFDRRVLDVLRQPLETGSVTISRAALQMEFPARFQLITAMNPCPCGYLGDPGGDCRCSETKVQNYRGKISGPLLDRIDMQVIVPRLPREMLRPDAPTQAGTGQVAARVRAARERQAERGTLNARLDSRGITRYCRPEPEGETLLENAADRLRLSARAYHKILKVARTIADLAGHEQVTREQISEAVQLRTLDSGLPDIATAGRPAGPRALGR